MPVHAVNNQIARDVNNRHARVLGFRSVSQRPIFHAEFGRYVAELRERRGWSQSDAARFGGKKNPALTRQVLLHLEAGKTKDPDPEVLRAVALLYGVSYEQIVSKLVACRYGLTLETTVKSGSLVAKSALPVEGNTNARSTSPPRVSTRPQTKQAIIDAARHAAIDLAILLGHRAETPSHRHSSTRRTPSRQRTA